MSDVLQIGRMTLAEKLGVMEALWDDLCRQEENIPVPRWHKDILDERERLIARGKATFVDWETAKKRIAGKLREDGRDGTVDANCFSRTANVN